VFPKLGLVIERFDVHHRSWLHTPENVSVLLVSNAQHVEKGNRTLSKSCAVSRCVSGQPSMIGAMRLGDSRILFQRRFESVNRRTRFFMHDHAPDSDALADNTEQVSREVLQHYDVWRRL
jgi:hypothetical protein